MDISEIFRTDGEAQVDRRCVDGHVVDVVGGQVVGGRVVGGRVVDVVGRIVDGPAEVALVCLFDCYIKFY